MLFPEREEQAHMSHLGEELIVHIFSSLSVTMVPEVSRVCRAWREAAHDNMLWRQYCMRDFDRLGPHNQRVLMHNNNIANNNNHTATTTINNNQQHDSFFNCCRSRQGWRTRYISFVTLEGMEWMETSSSMAFNNNHQHQLHNRGGGGAAAATTSEDCVPSRRWGHVFQPVDASTIVLFGGESFATTNSTYLLHIRRDSNANITNTNNNNNGNNNGNNRPAFSSSSSSSSCDNNNNNNNVMMMDYGGGGGGSGSGSNDGIRFEWELLVCSGRLPQPRYGHAGACIDGTLIIFGGSGGVDYLGDVNCLDIARRHWWQPAEQPGITGTPPCPRSSHSVSALGHTLYIFGGVRDRSQPTTCLNDLHLLDTQNWIWTQPEVSGRIPSPRFVHRVAFVNNRMFLFGGRTETMHKFNDTHWLDPETFEWHQVTEFEGTPPKERGGHSLVVVGNKILIMFGREPNDRCLYDGVHVLHTSTKPMRWTLRDDIPGTAPSARGAQGLVQMGKDVIIFGGYGDGPEERVLGDTHVLRLVDDADWMTPQQG